MKRIITAAIIAIAAVSALAAIPSGRTDGVFIGPEAALFFGDGYGDAPAADPGRPYGSRYYGARSFAFGADIRAGFWRMFLDIPMGYSYSYDPANGYYSAAHTLYAMPSVNIEVLPVRCIGFSVGAGIDCSFTYRNHGWSMRGEPIGFGSLRLLYRIGMTVDLSVMLLDMALRLPTGTFSHFTALPDMDAASVSLGFLFRL